MVMVHIVMAHIGMVITIWAESLRRYLYSYGPYSYGPYSYGHNYIGRGLAQVRAVDRDRSKVETVQAAGRGLERPSADLFLATVRRMPTANAEVWIEIGEGAHRKKGSRAGASSGTFEIGAGPRAFRRRPCSEGS